MPRPGRVGTCSARCAQVLAAVPQLDMVPGQVWTGACRLPKCTCAPLFFSESTGPDRGIGGRVPCPDPAFLTLFSLVAAFGPILASSPTRDKKKEEPVRP